MTHAIETFRKLIRDKENSIKFKETDLSTLKKQAEELSRDLSKERVQLEELEEALHLLQKSL